MAGIEEKSDSSGPSQGVASRHRASMGRGCTVSHTCAVPLKLSPRPWRRRPTQYEAHNTNEPEENGAKRATSGKSTSPALQTSHEETQTATRQLSRNHTNHTRAAERQTRTTRALERHQRARLRPPSTPRTTPAPRRHRAGVGRGAPCPAHARCRRAVPAIADARGLRSGARVPREWLVRAGDGAYL